jgi:hypothetical protein
VNGKPWTLSKLLADKPVLLVQGSWTCPRFQENRAALEHTVQAYGDAVHVVFVYAIEAHPQAPDPGPYHGKPNPRSSPTADRPGRTRNASVGPRGRRHHEALVLVDDFDAPGANPIWCTYGTCASCAWLIGQDGRIAAHHLWHDPPSMDASIQALLAPAADAPGRALVASPERAIHRHVAPARGWRSLRHRGCDRYVSTTEGPVDDTIVHTRSTPGIVADLEHAPAAPVAGTRSSSRAPNIRKSMRKPEDVEKHRVQRARRSSPVLVGTLLLLIVLSIGATAMVLILQREDRAPPRAPPPPPAEIGGCPCVTA